MTVACGIGDRNCQLRAKVRDRATVTLGDAINQGIVQVPFGRAAAGLFSCNVLQAGGEIGPFMFGLRSKLLIPPVPNRLRRLARSRLELGA